MTNRYGSLPIDAGQAEKKRVWNISSVLMGLYILLNYICQETLLAPKYHSYVMYLFVAWTVFSIFRRGRFLLTNFTIWQVAMLILSLVSILWAETAVMGALYNMLVGMVLSVCFIFAIDSVERLEKTLLIFVISADALGVLMILTGQMTADNGRLGQELTGNANAFASMIMISAIISGWFFVYKTRVSKYFNLASMLFCSYMLALSGGRKYLLVSVLCLGLFLVFKDTSKAVRILGSLIKAGIIVGLMYMAVMNIPVLYNAIGYRLESLFSMVSGGESNISSDALRQNLIRIGLEKWTESPLLGFGVDTFKYYNLRTTGHFYYAHNNYVELLYDLGLVGFLAYYGFYLHILNQLKKLSSVYKEYKILGISVILGFMVWEIGAVSYYSVFIQLILAVVYVMLILCKQDVET